jgi:hypothetical protein
MRLKDSHGTIYLVVHGTFYRETPKRDKSISARQWKKAKKLYRRLHKAD